MFGKKKDTPDWNRPVQKRIYDFEAFDKITFEVVPRFKTSGVSGDEWRTSVAVTVFFKGLVPSNEEGRGICFHYMDMQTALMMFPADWMRLHEPIPVSVLKIEEDRCFQPGCPEKWTHQFRIKKEFTKQGDELVMPAADAEYNPPHFRRFCGTHKERGNSSMEDQDKNYELMSTRRK